MKEWIGGQKHQVKAWADGANKLEEEFRRKLGQMIKLKLEQKFR